MKKVVCLLAVFAMVAPLYAATDEIVEVTLNLVGQDMTISYQMVDPNGVPITAVDTPIALGLKVDASGASCLYAGSAYSTSFELYPDAAYTLGYVDWVTPGDPVADPAGPGVLALGAASSASLSMARIQETVAGPNPGPQSDNLATLAIDGFGSITVTVSEDTLRGGIVATGPVANNLPQNVVLNLGNPACWSCSGHGQGNANGDTAINFVDLGLLKAAFGTTAAASPIGNDLGEYNPCADFDNSLSINFIDLGLLKANFGTTGYTACGTPLPPCEP